MITDWFHDSMIREWLLPRCEVIWARTPARLRAEIPKADALIALLTRKIDAPLLRLAPRLKVVANVAVGVDNIDLAVCKKLGITVVNTPEVLTRATAELALALLLAAARRLPEGERLCRSGKFTGWRPDLLLGLELKGRSAIVVGPGRIGTETSKLFRALGLRVSTLSRRSADREIRAKLQEAQVLSLHLPYTRATHHWLNRKRIALLPKDCIVINTARGPLIDEKALIQSLNSGKIFAVGLDVFENEPAIPRALRKNARAVLLPHLGSATLETRARMAKLAIQGALAVLDGKSPKNRVRA